MSDRFKPRLFRYCKTGLVVLFNDWSSGMIVHGDAHHEIGDYAENWVPCTNAHWEEIPEFVVTPNAQPLLSPDCALTFERLYELEHKYDHRDD